MWPTQKSIQNSYTTPQQGNNPIYPNFQVPNPYGYNPNIPYVVPQPFILPQLNSVVSTTSQNQNDEEDPRKNVFEVQHDDRFNLNHILSDNILKSDYFKGLFELKTYHEVITEICSRVKHIEPQTVGHSLTPSTAFCLLYKFFIMKLTLRQIRGLLVHSNLYVRGIGFLYLRFILPSKKIYQWFEEFLDDETDFAPGADKSVKIPFGKFVEELITEQKYFSTIFPRIPVPIMREYKKKLLLRERELIRNEEHEKYRRFFKVGTKVEAEYYEDHKWYNAIIENCIKKNGKFLVSFTDYGNKEVVSIGQIRFSEKDAQKNHFKENSRQNDKKRKKSSSNSKHRKQNRSKRHSHRSSRSRSYSRSKRLNSYSRSGTIYNEDEDIDTLIKRKEQNAALAIGRDYAKRPTSYKTSLSVPMQIGTARKRSLTPPLGPRYIKKATKIVEENVTRPKKTSSKAYLKKMAKLREVYGDASNVKKSE